jgi:MOSC domain-containing protein YiiM
MDVVRKFLVSGRPGIYFKVLKEGQVQVGDKIEVISKDKNNVTIKDIVNLYITRDHAVENIETMRRAVKINALPEGWKYEFQQNIDQLERRSDISYY